MWKGIDFLNSQRMLEWDGIKIPVVKKGFWMNKQLKFSLWEPLKEELNEKDFLSIVDKTRPLKDVYIKLNLQEVAIAQHYLNNTQQNHFMDLLFKHEGLFHGWCGNLTVILITICLWWSKTILWQAIKHPNKNWD